MNSEQSRVEMLLVLLRAALGNDISKAEELFSTSIPINWAEIYRYAAQQGVLAIAWDGINALYNSGKLSAEQMPARALKLQWALSSEKLAARYRQQREVLKRLATVYAKEGIRLTVLKGYGLSLCYPIAEHRECGDIDIWLDGEQQRADDILRQRFNIDIDVDKHHHTVFHIDGVMIENHYDFLNVHAHTSNRDIERELKQRVSINAEAINIDDATIYLPNVDCHALFLIRHAAAHFAAAEIVLRHIIDWAMFVKRYHDKMDWVWLYDVCRRHNMDRFLDVQNIIAIEVFGIDASYFPAITRRESLEKRIFNDIISPEFSEKMPQHGRLRIAIFKLRRWMANRWKHRLVYRENLVHTFVVQLWSHMIKPDIAKKH